jgi:hypothetical protein
MSKVWVVQGEHPFQPYYPLEVYGDRDAADRRCAELTAELLRDWWEIRHLDEDEPMPAVTTENWRELVEQYGCDESFVQDDAWGEWFVGMQDKDVRNA